MKTETLNSLKERRSIRSFKPEQITKEEINLVLEAGTYAPSAMNKQGTKLLVVQEKELLKKMSEHNAAVLGWKDKDPFYGAPTVVAVLADSDLPTYVEDGTLVMGNLLNAAYAVGLGSCWVSRAKDFFASPDGIQLKRELGIPDSYVGIAYCILGYPADEHPAARARKDDFIVWD